MTVIKKLKILFVEDLPSDTELAVLELRKQGLIFEYIRIDTQEECIRNLKEFNPDIVISDFMMPAYNGMRALIDAREYDPYMPFILLTGSMNEETAVECLKAGANDYVIKEHMTRLPFAVKEALEKHKNEKEKRAADQLLKENVEKIQSIFRVAPVGIGLTVNRVFMEVNDTFCKMTGYGRKELIGKNTDLLYETKDEYGRIGIDIYSQLADKETGSVETKLKCKDGKIINIILSLTPLDKNDPKKGVIYSVMDLTKRIRAEEALDQEKYLIYSLLNNLPDHIYFKDREGRFIRINKALTQSFGLKDPKQAVGKSDFDFFTDEHAQQAYKDEQTIIRTGQSISIEERETFPNGPDTWASTVKMPLRDKDDNIIGTFGISRDITERKLAEEALKESQHLFQTLAKVSPVGIFRINHDGNTTYVNPKYSELSGLSFDEAMGRGWLKAVHPDDKEKLKENWLSDLKSRNVSESEYRFLRPDGSIVWVMGNAIPEWVNDKIIGYIGTITDITDRKQAEVRLKSSEESLKILFDYAPDAYYLNDLKGTFVDGNIACEKLTGYSRNELIGKNFLKLDLLSFKHLPLATKLLVKNSFGQATGPDEFVLNRKDGSEVTVEIIAQPVKIKDRTLVLGMARDITYRKKTEETIRILARFPSENPGPILRIDQNGKLLYANEASYKILNWKLEIGKKTPLVLQKIVTEAIKEGVEKTFDTEHNQRIISFKIVPIGVEGYVNLYGRDVTEHKLAEQALRSSEERMRYIVKYDPNAIAMFDCNLHYIAVSDRYLKDYNVREADIIGKHHYEVFPEIPQNWKDVHQRCLAGAIEQNDDDYFERTDGSITYNRWECRPWKKTDGEIGGIITYTEVTTERKIAEKALRESEEKFRSIMENSADAIFITDPQGKYVYTNKAVTEMLGFTAEEMKTKTILDNTPPNKIDEAFNSFKKILSEGKVFSELELIKKDGNTISTDLNAVLLSGGLIYGSCRDITEKKHAQNELLKYRDQLEELVNERTEELNMAKKEAEEANRAKSEFLANMSHEIRTPMNAVLGYSELLSNLITGETEKNYLDSIKTSGRGLLSLINDILDLSKIEAGKLEFEFEFIDARSFFSEIEKIFSFSLSEKKLEFILDISSSTPMGLCIDEIRVRQILVNLVGNAIKFTNKGYIKISVWTENPHILKINEVKNEEYIDLLIEVEDTGIGISGEMQKLIFEAFQQENRRITKKYGGTGLGLTISRRLVELLNGTLTVESVVNKGSKFRVMIPDVNYTRDLNVTDNELEFDTSGIIFEPAVLIIADDIELNRRLIKDVLKNTSVKIVEAVNGEQAYNLAKEIIPDLIIADIRMPVVDGFELVQLIKNDPLLKNIPVVAYSASVMKSQKEKILQGNFAGLLSKPVRIAELYLELANNLPHQTLLPKKTPDPVQPGGIVPALSAEDKRAILDKLNNELMETWNSFSTHQPKELVKEFGNRIKDLGDKFNITMFTKYGNDLVVAINSFNIEALLKLINHYPKLIEKFTDHIKKSSNG